MLLSTLRPSVTTRSRILSVKKNKCLILVKHIENIILLVTGTRRTDTIKKKKRE